MTKTNSHRIFSRLINESVRSRKTYASILRLLERKSEKNNTNGFFTSPECEKLNEHRNYFDCFECISIGMFSTSRWVIMIDDVRGGEVIQLRGDMARGRSDLHSSQQFTNESFVRVPTFA